MNLPDDWNPVLVWQYGRPVWAVTIAVLWLLALAVTGLLSMWFAGLFMVEWHYFSGKVLARIHAPDTQDTDVGPAFTGGGVGLAVVSTGNPAQWVTVIEVEGDTHAFNNLHIWAHASVGQTVYCEFKHNRMWGSWDLKRVSLTPWDHEADTTGGAR